MTTLPEYFIDMLEDGHPGIWLLADKIRPMAREIISGWDDAIFMPMAGWHSVACERLRKSALDVASVRLTQLISFAGSRRAGKDIVRFVAEVATKLHAASFEGRLPANALWHLPAPFIYVDEDIEFAGRTWQGFMVMLEEDAQTRQRSLRLLPYGIGLSVAQLPLGDWSVAEGARMAMGCVRGKDWSYGLRFPDEVASFFEEAFRATLPLILHICEHGRDDGESWCADVAGSGSGEFPPPKPKIHVIGESPGCPDRDGKFYPWSLWGRDIPG